MSETKRDGKWIDEWGACKVCNGEIPYGHTENCDIYKLEREVAQLSKRPSLEDLKKWPCWCRSNDDGWGSQDSNGNTFFKPQTITKCQRCIAIEKL